LVIHLLIAGPLQTILMKGNKLQFPEKQQLPAIIHATLIKSLTSMFQKLHNIGETCNIIWSPSSKINGRTMIPVPRSLLLMQYRANITRCSSHNVASKLVHKIFRFSPI